MYIYICLLHTTVLHHKTLSLLFAIDRRCSLSSHRHRLFLRRRSYYSIFCYTTPTMIIVRSGSDTAVGPRRWNEDEHLLIDDVSSHLGSLYTWPLPNASFYAVFDGHGGSEAATYLKDNAMRFFFEDVDLPHTDDDDSFLKELEDSHRRAFLRADLALADDSSHVSSNCGTTALTALVVGRHLLVANAGDCRAVLCRNGVALQISNDHRPTYLPERQRVEELGGTIKFGYLNGELAVTRALGDWHLKRPFGSASPLTAEPDIHRILLTEEDEFLILACDGVWDVMSNEEAVDIVRNQLRQHHDPQQCATELVDHASCLYSKDNLTAIVVYFSYDGDHITRGLRSHLREAETQE